MKWPWKPDDQTPAPADFPDRAMPFDEEKARKVGTLIRTWEASKHEAESLADRIAFHEKTVEQYKQELTAMCAAANAAKRQLQALFGVANWYGIE